MTTGPMPGRFDDGVPGDPAMTTGRPIRRWPAPACLAGLLLTLGLTPAPAATLYGLIDTGELYSSGDNGVTWSPQSTLPVRDATALAARLTSSDLFLASRSGSIYRSMDAGVGWTAVGAIPASDVEDLAIRPDGTLLALSASGSLFQSLDLGASFTALAALTASNFTSLTFTTPAVKYYALTRTGEIYESTDDGATWSTKSAIAISDAVRIRAVQSSLYVLTGTGDVFKSTDAAASWAGVGTLSQVGMRGLVRNGTALAAASKEGHVATSADGVSWSWQGSMNQLTLTALASNEPATTGVEPIGPVARLRVAPPWPNPARIGTAVSFTFDLDEPRALTLVLHDLAGRQVAARPEQNFPAGRHTLGWDPGVKGTGLYFGTLRTRDGEKATVGLVIVD